MFLEQALSYHKSIYLASLTSIKSGSESAGRPYRWQDRNQRDVCEMQLLLSECKSLWPPCCPSIVPRPELLSLICDCCNLLSIYHQPWDFAKISFKSHNNPKCAQVVCTGKLKPRNVGYRARRPGRRISSLFLHIKYRPRPHTSEAAGMESWEPGPQHSTAAPPWNLRQGHLQQHGLILLLSTPQLASGFSFGYQHSFL